MFDMMSQMNPMSPILDEQPPMTPPLQSNGGLQPKQEFVSPGDHGLFDTMMGNQLAGPPQISPVTGAPMAPPQVPTAMNPPVSDMMQSPDLFNTMMAKQVPQAPPQEDPNKKPFPQF